MNIFTGIAASSSQHATAGILIVLGVLFGVVIVGALLWTFTAATAENMKGVPQSIKKYTGQFIGILIGGGRSSASS